MNCVRPPLLKKPARGFGWSCGPCSRKQEKKLEARNTPIVGAKSLEREEDEIVDEEDDEHGVNSDPANGSYSQDPEAQNSGPRPPTAEQIAQAKLWPYRYLGIHCRVEDALDYDDRIYPRASSRLGPKHQANVQTWPGRAVEFVKPADIKKKYLKGTSHKKDAKLTKETIAALEADKVSREKRPKWVIDEPLGYVLRGEDYTNSDPRNTAQLKFRLPQTDTTSLRGEDPGTMSYGSSDREELIDNYMTHAKRLAKSVGVKDYSTNFLDKALELLTVNGYDSEKALQQLQSVNRRKDLKEPELTRDEQKRFEEGVHRYGSELRAISRHVGKTQKHAEIVRWYYMWKKTERGKQIWGNYEGRKGKKQAKQADSKLADDVADDVDDSAFDNAKASLKKRGFECKFCSTRNSPQWRRAPATAPGTTVPLEPSMKSSRDKNAHLMLALCQRCAGLWRCYGIQWENLDELARKVSSGGGRAWKRRIDEELLIELVSANEVSSIGMSTTTAAAAASIGVEIPSSLTIPPGQEGPNKKQKIVPDAQVIAGPQNGVPGEPTKKKIIEKAPEPPLVPEKPQKRALPCAVCTEFLPVGDLLVECTHCRLTVHRNCYGISAGRKKETWICDMCHNDSVHQSASTTYDCILCSVRAYTDTELMEPPKISHKKKTDRERDKERMERDMVLNATALYRRQQKDMGRPEDPRQPLKKTTGNNWVHVICALFHSEIKFGDPKRLEPAEGFGAIPSTKYTAVCKLCKKSEGACINCSHCQASVHAACAQAYGYNLGFDLNPVKGSRSHAVSTVGMGSEVGNATAVVYCRDHPPKHLVHQMYEQIETTSLDPLNALQVFARTHKQADMSLTGTLRKALVVDTATKIATQIGNGGANHRGSNSSAASGAIGNSSLAATTRSSRVSPSAFTVKSDEVDEDGDRVVHLSDTMPAELKPKECAICSTDVSPKWHDVKPRVIDRSKRPPGALDILPQPANAMSSANGHTNGDSSDPPNDLATGLSLSHAEATTLLNGDMSGDGANDIEDLGPSTNQGINSGTNGAEPEVHKPIPANNASDEPQSFYCHKCHLRKLKEPTPPLTPTPLPSAPMEADPSTVQEPEPSSPQVPLVWPPTPQVPTPEPYRAWANGPSQTGQLYHGPERMSNGVPRSPPVIPPPPPQPHYPQPPPQFSEPNYRGTVPPYRDARGVLHRGLQPQFHVQQPVNGVPAEPPSFQYRRDSNGNLCQIPYVPPAMRGGSHAPPAHSLRSPPLREHSSHAPHGPPEAAENPFAVPNASHSPPRQAFGGMFGSPPVNHGRAETPPEGFGREGRWPSEMVNGASASPSLRNLLH